MKEQVEQYLKSEKKFRERSNKDRGIVNLLCTNHPELKSVEKEILVRAVREYNSMDRAWRQALEQDESLRGTDYGDKEKLEQEKLVDLGYAER